MKSLINRIRISAFFGCRAGMAATEFALTLPILIALFFGVVEGSSALSESRKVGRAVNALADLAAQERQLSTSDVDNLFDGVALMLPGGGEAATFRLVSVVADSDGAPVVDWSRDSAGAEPYPENAPYGKLASDALVGDNAAVIVAEVVYPYTPSLGRAVIRTTEFERIATRWPRQSTRVALCGPGAC